MNIQVQLVGVGLIVLAALAGTGCGSKVDDCNAAIHVHNKQVEGVQGVKDDDPEGMTKLAAVWSGAAADYGKLDVKTAEVKAITGKMQAGSTAVSVALASPAHGGDAVKAAVEQYNKAATELQTFCGVEDKK
jgi:hypothetical protein